MSSRRSVDEHIEIVRSLVGAALVGEETVPLETALGRVTASEVLSPVDLPLFRNSQMDGFAVRASDLAEDVALPIVGVVPARAITPPPLEPGTSVRIMTGAVVPDGADTVIPVEDTTVAENTIVIHRVREIGDYVRERGSDAVAGSSLVPADVQLAPRHLAALAAAGLAEVTVHRRARVAILSSGSELVAPGARVELGQIYDSNAVALGALVTAAGGMVVFSDRVSDDAPLFRHALALATAAADLVVTSGGISMGNHEVVRDVLEPLGADVVQLAMQPGGPQATALVDGVPVVCFPGNPVSTQVSFAVFLAPLLRAAAGLPPVERKSRALVSELQSIGGRRQFLRGRIIDNKVELVSGPGSHLVAGLAAADVLVDVSEETTQLAAGEFVATVEL